jgi:hypothetical protein
MEFGTCQDEVKQYLDAPYVSACEALWRIHHFHMHEEYPAVVRLQIHLPNQQLISWDEHVAPNLQQVVAQAAEKECSLPSPTDSRWSPPGLHKSMWSPDGVHLKKTSTHNSIQNPYGLHMDSYGIHLESKWSPDGLNQRRKILSSPQDS